MVRLGPPKTPARLTMNGKGMGRGGREAGWARLGMCSVGRGNVFSFWPDVFTFRLNVFTLAGQVFSFRWRALVGDRGRRDDGGCVHSVRPMCPV